MGTFSIVSLMSGAVVDKHFPDSTRLNTTTPTTLNTTLEIDHVTDELYDKKVELSISLSFLVGILHLSFGLFNLGCLSVLLPKPVVSGFTTGSAIIVTLAQATHIFGFPVQRYSGLGGPIKTFIQIIKQLFMGASNISSVIISLISIPLLYTSKLAQIKYKDKLRGFPIPTELFLVVITTVIVEYLLPVNNDVIVVGPVPGGLPYPKIPNFKNFEIILPDAIAIAIVSYATTLSLGKIFSNKKKYSFSPNQEGIALGCAHIFGSFFSCFPGSAALARSSLQESSGGMTHLASLISSLFMLFIILWIGPIFESLPRSVLSCIVIVNLRSMFLQFQILPS
jgi:MFS superfamily sulfate permease-like transporter